MTNMRDKRMTLPSKPKKTRSPYLWLLMIPIQLILDVIVFYLGVAFEVTHWEQLYYTENDMMGHPLPLITFFIFFVLCGITVFVLVLSIILTVSARERRLQNKKQKEPAERFLEDGRQ